MSQSEYEDDPDIEEAFENAAKDMWVLAKKGASVFQRARARLSRGAVCGLRAPCPPATLA